jgi:hypothetical protein
MLKYKFPDCKDSIYCRGCREFACKHEKEEREVVIHNNDVIHYAKTVPSTSQRYYEFISVYEDSINEKDGSLVPFSHGIKIHQSRRLKKLEGHPGSYACGGCAFILKKVDKKKSRETVLCTNGWPGYEDGWHI